MENTLTCIGFRTGAPGQRFLRRARRSPGGRGPISIHSTLTCKTHRKHSFVKHRESPITTHSRTNSFLGVFTARPRSHRTRKQICPQIGVQTLWMLLATCVNTPIYCSVFHNLHVRGARCSASCVNRAQGVMIRGNEPTNKIVLPQALKRNASFHWPTQHGVAQL